MPVAAGVVAVLCLLAIRTDINLATQGFRTAGLKRLHGLQMVGGDASGVLLAISRPAEAENLGQFYPHRRPTTALIAAMAGASTWGVRWV